MESDNRNWRINGLVSGASVDLPDQTLLQPRYAPVKKLAAALRKEERFRVLPPTATYAPTPSLEPKPAFRASRKAIDMPVSVPLNAFQQGVFDPYPDIIREVMRVLEFARSAVIVDITAQARSASLRRQFYDECLQFFQAHDEWRKNLYLFLREGAGEEDFRALSDRGWEIADAIVPTLSPLSQDIIERQVNDWREYLASGFIGPTLMGDSPLWGVAPDAIVQRRMRVQGLDIHKAYNSPYWVELPEQWPLVYLKVAPEFEYPERFDDGYGPSANSLFKSMVRERRPQFDQLTTKLVRFMAVWEERLAYGERARFKPDEIIPQARNYFQRAPNRYGRSYVSIPPSIFRAFKPKLINLTVPGAMNGEERVIRRTGAVRIKAAGRLFALVYAALQALIWGRKNATAELYNRVHPSESDLRNYVFDLEFEITYTLKVRYDEGTIERRGESPIHQHGVYSVSSPFSFAATPQPLEDSHNDPEWGQFVENTRQRDYLELSALMAQWVLNTIMTPLYRLITGREEDYGYGGAQADIPIPIEAYDDDSGEVLYPTDYSAAIDSLQIRARKKVLSRTVDYHTVMLNLFSESPAQWRWVQNELSGFVPDARASRTECAYLSSAAAYCLVKGISRKSAGSRAKKMKRRCLQLFGEDFLPSPTNFFTILSTLAAPGGYPARGWGVENIPVKIITVDLSNTSRDSTRGERALAWDATPDNALLNPHADENGDISGEIAEPLTFLMTAEHVVPMIRPDEPLLGGGGRLIDNPEFSASDVITSHRYIEPLSEGSYKERIPPVVVVYDLETLNSSDGFEGPVEVYAAGWMETSLNVPFICTVDKPVLGASPDEQRLQISPLKRMLYQIWQSRRVPYQVGKDSPNVYMVAHNGSGFDHYLLFRSVLEDSTLGFGVSCRIVPKSVIRRGGRLMAFNIELRHGKRVKYLKMRDTFLYWRGSLDKVGTAFDCAVSKSEFPYEEVRSFEDMWTPNPLRRKMEEYLKIDVLLLNEIVVKMRALFYDLFHIELLKSLTVSAIARKIFFQDYFKDATSEYVGVPTEERIICPSLEFDTDYRQSFFGGRNEMFWKGTFTAVPEEGIDLWYIDATSLYPSVMGQEKYPIGLPNRITAEKGTLDQFKEAFDRFPRGAYTAVIKCSLRLYPHEGARVKPFLARRVGFAAGGTPVPEKGSSEGSRLVFAWGFWEGWLILPELDYILEHENELFDLREFQWTKMDVYLLGTPLMYTVRRLFKLKGDIDKELNPTSPTYGNLTHEAKLALASRRQVIKLMINSLYGFWAIKVVKNRSFDVADSTSDSYLAAMRSEYSLCWTESFNTQTVFEYDSVLETNYRNVLIGLWTSVLSRFRLYKMIVDVERVPWRHALYVDTDSVHILDAHRFEHPNFWEDVILRDPAYSRHSELGGWTNEMQDKMGGRLGKLMKLSIVGLKLYSYTIEYPDGEIVHGYKSRGVSSRWLFEKREEIEDADGKKAIIYSNNYSKAYHKTLREANPDYPGPFSVTEKDLTDLAEEKVGSVVCVIYTYRAGGAALSRRGSPMSKIKTHRTLQIVEQGKGTLGERTDLPGSPAVRPIVPFLI